jgi:hypothetical protein
VQSMLPTVIPRDCLKHAHPRRTIKCHKKPQKAQVSQRHLVVKTLVLEKVGGINVSGNKPFDLLSRFRNSSLLPSRIYWLTFGLFIALGLLPTFSTWSQVTFLHMYLLTVRLRALSSPESVRTHLQHLSDHYSHNAETRMDIIHGITTRSIRNKYLKDLFLQWRGVLAAYDEGMARGDAILAAAVWRNIWKAEPLGPDGEDIDWAKIATVVTYMRRVTEELSKVDELDLIFAVGGNHRGQPAIFGPRPSDIVGATS